MGAANRLRQGQRPEDPVELQFELNLEHIPCHFLRGDMVCGDRRHLIFASDQQLQLLSRALTWYLDGTFYVVKSPFTQLFSIHAVVRQEQVTKQVPLVFVLMSLLDRY